MQNKAAVILAAGNGLRFDSNSIPKQFHKLSNGNSILEQTIINFKNHVDIICVVINNSYIDMIPKYNNVVYTYGGTTRQESVKNGLNFLTTYNPQYVLIHDAVRPFTSYSLIQNVLYNLQKYEAVDIGLPIVDTLKTYNGIIIPRNNLYCSQTPQGFHFSVILELHNNMQNNTIYTDDISLYLANSTNSNLVIVQGEVENFKITYKQDIQGK